MRSPWSLIVIGVALIVMPVTSGIMQSGTKEAEAEARDIDSLRVMLDSARAALAAAAASDTARLSEAVRSREYFLSRRTYHAANRAAPRPFWRPTGPPALLATGGLALMIAGGVQLVRRRAQRPGAPGA